MTNPELNEKTESPIDFSKLKDFEEFNALYDQAQAWVRENRTMLYLVGGILAVGAIGYVLGRGAQGLGDRRRTSEIEDY